MKLSNMKILVMRSLMLFLVVFTVLSGINTATAQQQFDLTYTPDDFFTYRDIKYLYHGKQTNEIKEGPWIIYYAQDSGLFKVENYRKGLKHGLFLEFSTRSTLVSEQNFDNDVPDGLQRTYTNAGIVETVSFYKKGKLEGPQKKYYENRRDKLSEISNYKDGLKEGKSMWFDMEGNIVADYNYHNGLLEGPQKSFYTNGRLRSVDNFIKNQYEGESVEYYDDGNLKTSGLYLHGEKNGKWQKFDATGKVVSTETYKNGQLR